jgi:hypothetical protein
MPKKSIRYILRAIVMLCSAFTIYQYILLTNVYLEKNYIGYMYKQWFKNKVKHTQRAHYIAWIWRLTGITFTPLQLPVKCS